MVITSGLLLLLAACVAAYDNYDEAGVIDLKGDVSYYDDNGDIDSGQFDRKLSLHDLMMLKLISSMPNSNSDDWRLHPVFNMIENQMLGWPHSAMDFKRDVVKKRTPATASDKPIKVKPRYQPRWRIKRPPRLCLLKLCPSMYYAYE